MLTLELDGDGYPTEDTLRKVAQFPIRLREDCAELLAAVRAIWHMAEHGYWHEAEDEGKAYYFISTCGWSGNESLIYALEQNTHFWDFCWEMSHRGGHYVLRLPRKA